MRPEAVARLDALPADARVLDVGGWASPLPRADAVLDLLPHATRGLYPHEAPAERGERGAPVADGAPGGGERREATLRGPGVERFDAASWEARDVCAREPWPYPDGAFDLAVCSHTLEDLRDPVGVCRELSRVARAGYVEVPAPVEELTIGLQGPWVGWSHHRWICELVELPAGTWGARVAAVPPGPPPAGRRPGLRVTHKPHLLAAPGRHLAAGTADRVRPEQRVLALWWDGEIPCEEVVHVGAESLDAWLAGLLDAHGGAAPAPRPRRWRPGRGR